MQAEVFLEGNVKQGRTEGVQFPPLVRGVFETLGVLIAFVCALFFIRYALELWRSHRLPRPAPPREKSYEEKLQDRTRGGPTVSFILWK